MANRIATYICSGCRIAQAVDIQKLCEKVTGIENVILCRDHKAMCSPDGISYIVDDLEKEKPDAILVAACSQRFKVTDFDFGEEILLERVNIREHVAWTLEAMDEDTLIAAGDYIRMGIEKLKAIKLPEPYIPLNICEDILVVGGGITGITAAIEGAKAGYRVRLVEKSEIPGGFVSKLHRQIPSIAPYTKPVIPIIHELISELENQQNIEVHLSTEIRKISGEPGNFNVELQNGKPESVRVGAIISATGWKPYDPSKLSHLGYGKPGVMTGVEFEEFIRSGEHPRLPENILFIQCAGSRDKDHLPYCSNVCCGTSLKQAMYIRDQSPGSSVFIIYKDIRTTGLYEEFYRECQKDEQLFLTKGDIQEVSEKDGKLNVEVKNTLLGEDILLEVDMIVLATGMVPAGTTDLNLAYRLGKGLPDLKYSFPDSHFICFPYETRRTGIYAAGAVRAPMDIPSCMEDAAGAMLKAIQCVESVKRGEAVHPRSGDRSWPDLYMDRCTDCKRCTEECPFGSYDENEKGTPILNPARCRRCGICLGSCPERVINFSDYSINSVSAMIKSVEIPDEFEEKPRILVFVCENDAYPAIDMAAQKGLKLNPWIRIIPVRCLGSINKVWILDALSRGYDGILQIGCKPGDNYQCHFIHGSELTETRAENIQEALQTMMLEPERIKTEFVEITDYDRIPEIIADYAEEIEMIGPNPFKGM